MLAGQPRLDRVEMFVCGLLSQFYTPWSLGFKSHKPLAESAQRGPSLRLLVISWDWMPQK